MIVPGHGAPLHDKTLLHATMQVFRELLRQGKDANAKGLTVDQATAAIVPTLRDAMLTMTHDDPKSNADFRVFLAYWFLHRVYDELDGPLSDAIAPIPPPPKG